MEVPDNLLCLYNAELKEQDGSYVIEVPAREVSNNQIASGDVYRAAVLQRETRSTNTTVRRNRINRPLRSLRQSRLLKRVNGEL